MDERTNERAGSPPAPAARITAVLGKGGVGKTVVSALLARILIDEGRGPLLLVDADPAFGLTHAVGGTSDRSLGQVKEQLIHAAENPETDRDAVARSVDYLLLQALQERDQHSLLAMGRTEGTGCFCPVNTLLRTAIEHLLPAFSHIIVDAEAGVEQINRQVVSRVDTALIVADGSRRSYQTAALIDDLVRKHGTGPVTTGLVLNRSRPGSPEPPDPSDLPERLHYLGRIPEDPNVRAFDEQGKSLLELPAGTAALTALAAVVQSRGL